MTSTEHRATTLAGLAQPDLIFLQIPGTDGPSVLRHLADRLADANAVGDADSLYQQLLERERLGSTGIGRGVAIPHCKLAGLERVVLAIGVSARPVEYQAVDQQPVRAFFLLVSPDGSPAVHLQSLAAISKWAKNDDHLARMLAARDRNAVLQVLTGGADG